MSREQDYNKGIRILVPILIDIIAINIASLTALFVKFDFRYDVIPVEYFQMWKGNALWCTAVTILIFYCLRLYHSIGSHVGIREAILAISAVVLATMTEWALLFGMKMPIGYFVIKCLIECFMILGIRFYNRLLCLYDLYRVSLERNEDDAIMLIGAGEAGKMILKEYMTSKRLNSKVCCIIDDDITKVGKKICGVPVVGTRECIIEKAGQYNIKKIIIAMPNTKREQRRDILEICQKTNCEVRILPGLYQLINGEVAIEKLRNVEIEDLLGRDPIKVNLDEIMSYVKGKTILVTGGGGSIGSEICRQIASYEPKQLILVDIYENSAYDIQQELLSVYPNLDLKVLIASVRNTNRINQIFEEYRPNIVYHAAAHKHVPLMEESPNEAIKNNVFGTYKTAMAADRYGVERFVLISTDKAVNPTNIMGASKRLCEMIIQMFNNRSKTDFVAVRFGNVLGSNGSVIPLFKRQIEKGGPVTVTHPEIIRYFMTIQEAVSLVLQAGSYAKGGEIFIFDMGEPVKILDLAKNLIRLSGLRVGDDIQIQFTGLRPGEKLYEELLMQEEGMTDTDNELIHIGKPIIFDEDKLEEQLEQLRIACEQDVDNIKELMAEIVQTYQRKKD